MRNILFLIDQISDLLISNEDLPTLLSKVVNLIANHVGVETCSLFLLDKKSGKVTLKANIGFDENVVPSVSLEPGEGLVGTCFEQGEMIHEIDASKNKNFKFFKGLGEEKYPQFIAHPIIFRKSSIGVLAIQTSKEVKVNSEIKTFLKLLSSQLAMLLKNVEIHNKLQNILENEPKISIKDYSNKRVKGIGVSKGISIGKTFFINPANKIDNVTLQKISLENINEELNIFKDSLKEALEELESMSYGLSTKVQSIKEIITGQILLLKDVVLHDKINTFINKKYSLPSALKLVYEEYKIIFNNMEDPYFKERLLDLKDVLSRLLSYSSAKHKHTLYKESILVVEEMFPSYFLQFDLEKIKGIVTKKTTYTSHSVILAKAFNIPMRSGTKEIFEYTKEGDMIILDAQKEEIIVNPYSDVIKEYENLLKNTKRFKKIKVKGDPITKDGYFVKLSANLGLIHEIPMVLESNFYDIGLYRTEFLFLLRKKFPTIKEQYEIYTTILKRLKGKGVTFRTLDLGGDKQLPYFPLPQEDNPLLGFRSIRIFKKHPNILKDQLKALMMAAYSFECKIMFPLVNNYEDFNCCYTILKQAEEDLKNQGVNYKIPPLGIMVETPASIFNLVHIAPQINFASVGTNDLLQYLMAIDRNNSYSDDYNMFDPSFIKCLFMIGKECSKNKIELNICGEIAGNPLLTPILIGAGFNKLSMVPSSISDVLKTVQKLDIKTIKKLCDTILTKKNALNVKNELEIFYDTIFKGKAS